LTNGAGLVPLPADVAALVEAPNFAHLATIDAGGAPAVTAVWVTVIDEHAAFFTSPATNHGRNIMRDPRVALSIIDFNNPYTIVRIRGRIENRIEGADAVSTVHEMAHKYLSTPYPHPVPPGAFISLVTPTRAAREDYSDIHNPAKR
jgi:PPOX class probable F420-dependent enzyme